MNNCSHGREIRNERGCSDTSERLKTKNKSMITLLGLKRTHKHFDFPTPNPHNLCVIYKSLELGESHFLIRTTEITLPTARLLRTMRGSVARTTCVLGPGNAFPTTSSAPSFLTEPPFCLYLPLLQMAPEVSSPSGQQ